MLYGFYVITAVLTYIKALSAFNGGIFTDELLNVTPYGDSRAHFDNFDQFKFSLV